MTSARREEMVARFMSRVEKTSGCWIWVGGPKNDSYGQFYLDGKKGGAHRAAYELFVGEIPGGAFICHHCDNKRCVRPDHLYAGDIRTNTKDAVERNRVARGERSGARLHPESQAHGTKHPLAKITEADAEEIRRLHYKVPQREIAKRFGIGRTRVQMIQLGQGWKHQSAKKCRRRGCSERVTDADYCADHLRALASKAAKPADKTCCANPRIDVDCRGNGPFCANCGAKP